MALTGTFRDLPRRLFTGCTCQGCERVFHADLIVADELWEQITPKPGNPGAGLLCPTCIVERLVQRGFWTGGRAFNVDSVVQVIIE